MPSEARHRLFASEPAGRSAKGIAGSGTDESAGCHRPLPAWALLQASEKHGSGEERIRSSFGNSVGGSAKPETAKELTMLPAAPDHRSRCVSRKRIHGVFLFPADVKSYRL